jgi:hypothetical protein
MLRFGRMSMQRILDINQNPSAALCPENIVFCENEPQKPLITKELRSKNNLEITRKTPKTTQESAIKPKKTQAKPASHP